MAIEFKESIEVPGLTVLGVALGTLAFSSATIPTDNNQISNGAGYVTSSGNTTIGINQNNTLNTSTVFATLNFTNGVATSATTRTLTLGDLGITGSGGNSGNWNTAYLNSVSGITAAGTSNITITLGQPGGVLTASFSNPQGTVTSVAASISGNGLAVAVANPTTSPSIVLDWQGASTEYIKGDGNRAAFPTVPTNNNQLTNGAGYISELNKGSYYPEATQTIPAGGAGVLIRTTLEFDQSAITQSGYSVNASGSEITVAEAQVIAITLNFASKVTGTLNRTLGAAVLQYAESRGEFGDIQGTQLFNYDRGTGTSTTNIGFIHKGSSSVTVLHNAGAGSKIRAQFWIEGRSNSNSSLQTVVAGCRLSMVQVP